MATNDVFLKEQTNYIVVQRRNGVITDVWKLEDSVIEYSEQAKGWRVITNKNAVFFISGDVELWHIPDKTSELWEMYHKFHAHNSKKTYRELYVEVEPPPPPPKKKGWKLRWPYTIKWNW